MFSLVVHWSFSNWVTNPTFYVYSARFLSNVHAMMFKNLIFYVYCAWFMFNVHAMMFKNWLTRNQKHRLILFLKAKSKLLHKNKSKFKQPKAKLMAKFNWLARSQWNGGLIYSYVLGIDTSIKISYIHKHIVFCDNFAVSSITRITGTYIARRWVILFLLICFVFQRVSLWNRDEI